MQIHIRDVELDDFDRIAEIMRQSEPHEMTGEVLRQRHLNYLNDGGMRKRVVAIQDDRIVAVAQYLWAPNTPPGIFMLRLYVDEGSRGQGLGRRLFSSLEEQAIALGAKRLICIAYEKNERSRLFLERAGYYEEQKLFESELDVSAASSEAWPSLKAKHESEGVSFVHYPDLADDETNRRNIHRLTCETDKDTPGMEFWGLPDYEQFCRMMFGDPHYRADGLFFAVQNGEWIAMHHLETTSPELCWVEFTGVLPEHRGRGLAYALKIWGLDWAKKEGVKRMKTNNDTRNAAMLHVNRKMGFAEQPGWLHMHRVVG